jgi:dTDP-4-dehydrorhamnose reductase
MIINKIILFGKTGMLGNYIYKYFKNKLFINCIDYRITNQNFSKLEELLIENNIDNNTCVINCIGLIPQKKNIILSDKEYYLINSLFPHILWQICKKYKCKMIQPSTDCVFNGKKGNYNECDIHDEINAYGISKSLGEPLECTIIRTSIIGLEIYNKKSFMEWVLSNNNNKINGYTNHLWNGITCLEYCKVIDNIISNNIFWEGIKHIYSPEKVSKYELASMISSIFQLNIEIIPSKTEISYDKTLTSIYNNNFNIKSLYLQIEDLKNFSIN